MYNDALFKDFIGIDVAKDKLDIFLSQSGEFFQIANDKKSIKSFIKKLEFSKQCLVVIDLTGGYEQVCVNEFYAHGYSVHRAEGLKISSFKRALGKQAKTDRIDAQVLAKYGEKFQERLQLYVPGNEQLKLLVMRIADLKGMLQQEKNRNVAPLSNATVKASISSLIKVLEKEILKIEQYLVAKVNENPELRRKFELLKSQKGVGEKTALNFLFLLPELGYCNRRKIAALAGVAPYPKDSGNSSAYRRTYGGRQMIKKSLFICALVAIVHDVKLKAFYTKLVEKGKKKLVALVAVMRKLLIILNNKCKELSEPPDFVGVNFTRDTSN